jgi:SAM-dependent methyltransferase
VSGPAASERGKDRSRAFWDRVASRYAAMPIRNPEGYEQTLEAIRARLSPSDEVLELGCGTGTTALHLAGHVARYVATDYAPAMIAIAQEKVEQASLSNVEAQVVAPGEAAIPKGPFDAVVALNLLHLLPKRESALEDSARRLRPGGLFISKTPCLSGVWLALAPVVWVFRLMGKAPDFRFLSAAKLERDIVRAGFEIVENTPDPNRPPRRFIVARKI